MFRSGSSAWWRSDTASPALFHRPYWKGDGGLRQLLIISFPLVMSNVSAVVNMFFDRYFLASYDVQYHMTASLSGGVVWWALIQLITGIVSYGSTFVAQYHGAERGDRIGAAVWQSIYAAILGGVVVLLTVPLWQPLFDLVHDQDAKLAALEATYCQALSFGGVFLVLSIALSNFYTGLGRTLIVLLVTSTGNVANIFFNKWLIFNPPEWLPFIEPGISGAAWGTSFAWCFAALIYMVFVFAPKNQRGFRIWSAWRFDFPMFRRLFRYGLPQSMHLFIDVLSFSVFVLMVGRIDLEALTATNAAFTINLMIFAPLIGFGQGLTILVGRFIGAKRVDRAERSTSTAFIVALVVMSVFIFMYYFTPDVFIRLFLREDNPSVTPKVLELSRLYLKVVALYSLFDVFAIIYSSALKGAGDTKIIFQISLFCGMGLLLVPSLVITNMGGDALHLWFAALAYIIAFGTSMLLRYRAGYWREMSVIEHDLVAEVEAEESQEAS